MLEGMPGQCRMVCLNIEFKISIQSVVTQKANSRGRIEIILMLHWFLGFGFNIEITSKTNGTAILYRHFHQSGNIIKLQLHICVKKRLIALTSAPEHITFAIKFYS